MSEPVSSEILGEQREAQPIPAPPPLPVVPEPVEIFPFAVMAPGQMGSQIMDFRPKIERVDEPRAVYTQVADPAPKEQTPHPSQPSAGPPETPETTPGPSEPSAAPIPNIPPPPTVDGISSSPKPDDLTT